MLFVGRVVKLLFPLVTAAVVLGAEALHAKLIGDYPITTEPRFAWVIVLIVVLWTTTYVAGVSEPVGTNASRFVRASAAVGSGLAIVGVIELLARRPLLPLFVLGVCVVVLVPALTLTATLAQRSHARAGQHTRVVAVCEESDGLRLARDVDRAPELPTILAAVVRPRDVLPAGDDSRPLETLARDVGATLVVLGREAQACDEIVAQTAVLHRRGVRVRTLSLFYEQWLGRLPISELGGLALLFDVNEVHRPVYARTKRLADVALAVVALPVFVLATVCVALADLLGNRGPLFYRQPRVGKGGVVFTILKFRTLAPGAPGDGLGEGALRPKAVGGVLRRVHLHELPQVWNLLRRDLSIVGPRPEQPRYVEEFTRRFPFYDARHLVRPGITGWAQVKADLGMDESEVLEKLQYDLYYLRRQSLGLDARIIGRTLRVVVSGPRAATTDGVSTPRTRAGDAAPPPWRSAPAGGAGLDP